MIKSAHLRSIHAALLAGALALAVVPDVRGQTSPGNGDSSNGDIGSSAVSATVAVPTDYLTSSIVKNINGARAECGSYDPAYRIDCLRQRLADIAQRIPAGPAYSEARQIISRASSKLGRIQAGIVDRKAPQQRSRANPRLRQTKIYAAAKREKLGKAMAQARQVIEEAETQLLRAVQNSDKRAGHYQQIAAALDSTKVLLRS
ncbi:hypothetical protein MUO32_22660 [Shinella sp. CPCC 101442]|uniref:hypothetical protein n=1 Tax=Shinella sp. CPCC 101442 TaxID=2932265 RepID=UPI0021526BCA|nr:hypothetical protein [Shinella sp. CPCC 101442]MCR6501841.1 hypothetical protein [Shinella sp. CPCC 101442]